MGKGNSGSPTAYVQVEQAFTDGQSSLNWAIGGVRASVYNSDSFLLFNQGGAQGDMDPGWAVEMQSGHTESAAGGQVFYSSNSAGDAFIQLRGCERCCYTTCHHVHVRCQRSTYGVWYWHLH